MVLATVACLAAMGWHQATPDVSKDPRLQQPIDVHLKRVLLPDLLRYLKVHSNQLFIMEDTLKPLMVCVFAEHQPLGLIMKNVAEVVGGQWKDLGSEWRLVESSESKLLLPVYENSERQVLIADIKDRARALAEAVSKHSWSELAKGSDSSLSNISDDATPEQWAEAKIHDPAYFVAGLMFARTRAAEEWTRKFDCFGGFANTYYQIAYRLIVPPTEKIAESLQCSAAGDAGAGLEGAQILARPAPWAGSLQSVVVGAGSRPDNRPKHLIRYPKPVGYLAKTSPGKWLMELETPLDDSDDPILDKQITGLALQPPPFHGGGQGIEDYLEALADALKIPVVSDAFRMPVIGKEPVKGADLRHWLESLRTRQGSFVHVQNGSVCIRHGGFWDLRTLEIPEEALRRFEAIPRPGLDEYADFAFEQGWWGNTDRTYLMPFFESQEVPLTLFDSKPFQTNPVALAAFGELTNEQRLHLLSGGFVNWYRDIQDDLRVTHNVTFQKSPKTGLKIILDEMATTGRRQGTDFFINSSGAWGVFYGGIPVGIESKLLEAGVMPSAYRYLWSDSPDYSTQFVNAFDPVTLYHAHFFSFRNVNQMDIVAAQASPRRLYGTFKFFSAVSDVDGVIAEVVIPDKGGH